MKSILQKFLFLILLTITMQSYGSHVMGVDLSYECLAPGKYLVRLQAYRDCNGVSMGSSHTITVASAQCGVTTSITVNQVGPATDVTPLCPGANSKCGSGGTYGIQKYVYEGVLNLPIGCGTDWKLGWSLCCRNAAINSLSNPSNEGVFIEAELNNTLAQCDNSPVFLNDPVPFYCANQLSNYNHGVVDADGDSLVFSIVPALSDNGNQVAYASGFSPTQPLKTTAGFNINSQNGDLSFTPSQVQIGVVKVAIDEYRNGVKIGRVVRDMQFIIANCTNNIPTASGVNGTNNYSITIPACSNACFTINSADLDAANVVTMTSNNAITGSTFTTSTGNRPVGTFCWSPTPADTGVNFFTITVKDNACQIIGSNTYSYTVRVTPSSDPPVNGGPDLVLCPGQSTTLSATAGPGAVLTWSNGTTTQSGATWNVNPVSTTLYTVSASYPNGCVKTDNVLITRAPAPTISAYPPVITLCSATDSAQLNASSSTGINYQWTPANGGLNCATCQNPKASPGTSRTYTVIATDANGCPSPPATITVNLNPPPPLASCAVIYIKPGGSTAANAGTQTNPADLATGLAKAQCNNAWIKIARGRYVVDYPISNIGSYTTLEGGYDSITWQKSSTPGLTTIFRNNLNLEGLPTNRRLVAVYLNGASYFRFQDITIQTDNTPALGAADSFGISNYVIHMTGSSNYDFVRTQLIAGNATGGRSGVPGTGGTSGNPGGNASGRTGGTGGTGPTGNGGTGGQGGSGGVFSGNNGSAGTAGANGGGAGGAAGSGGVTCASSIFGGTNPTVGAAGATGTAGVAGAAGTPASFSGGFFVIGGKGGNGTSGGNGLPGGGGGGAGGAGAGTAGGGGGGGGGGATGGTAGTGGFSGGSSFALFSNIGGAGGNVVNSRFTAGLVGAAGSGGSGGIGGSGGAGGIGTTAGCDSDPTGNGGAGGAGGNGGNGGNGVSGFARAFYNLGGAAPSTLDTLFNLASQPTINVANISCTYRNDTFTTAIAGAWDAGSGASNPTSNGTQHLTQYTTIGRKNLTYGGNIYTGFVNMAIDASTFLPDLQTTASVLTAPDSFYVCLGSSANYSAVIASADSFQWDFGGATVPNTYLGGSTMQTLTNRVFNTAGVFKIKVRIKTDCCGWSAYDSIYLLVERRPTLVITGNTVLCPGDSAVVTLSGASSYLWTPSNYLSSTTTPTVVAKPPNSFTYFVTGYSPRSVCNKDTVIPIQVITPPSLSFNVKPATCGSNGTIKVTPTSSVTSAYTYVWTANANGQTSDSIINLASGPYQVTATQAVSGCKVTGNTVVTTAGGLQAFVDSSVNVRCFGQNNGFARATAIQGAAPFTYRWSSPGVNTRNNPNLIAGTYTVTITDNNTCTASATVTISQPPLLQIVVLDTISTSCFYTCDGRATIDAFGGNSGFVYAWSNGQDSTTGVNLCRGTYQVGVIDNKNCTATTTVIISSPPLLNADTLRTVRPSCFGSNDGQIILNVTGGVYPYGYTWVGLPAEKDSIGSPLYAGTYVIFVKDTNNCKDTVVAVLSQPTQIRLSVVRVDSVSCFGGNDGRIEVSASGSNGNYQFSNNGGAVQASGIFSALATGQYSISVSDAKGCDTTLVIDVFEPSLVDLVLAVKRNVRCNGNSDGMIRVAVSGGNGGYQFTRDGVTFQTIDSFTNLAAGNYVIGVRDRKGCLDTIQVILTEPTPLVLSQVSVTAPSCNTSADGALEVSASGGVSPYLYNIDYQSTTQLSGIFNGVTGGNHTLIVIDANQCIDSITVNVPAPPPSSSLDTAVVDVSCFGLSDGSIDLTIIGALGPYTVLWSSGETTEDISGKPAGKYFAHIEDNIGCRVGGIDSIEIKQPAQIVITPTTRRVSCFGGNDGCIDLTVSGGTPAYTYIWSGGQTIEDICGLTQGSYGVTVTDSKSCTAFSNNIVVAQPTALTLNETNTSVQCPDRTDGTIDLTVLGGTMPYRYSWNPGGANTQDLNNLAVGPYTVIVTDSSNCTATLTANVSSIPEMQINPAVRNVYCFPLQNGAIFTLPTGGTPPYQYNWSNGSIQSYISGQKVGTYSVIVKDANGCLKDSSFTLVNDNSFVLVATPRDTLIELGEAVQLGLYTEGGNPVEVVWSPVNSLDCSTCPSPVSSTTNNIIYKVVVVSDSGCTAKDSVIIRVNPTYQMYIPNAFTPNGDGFNDLFEVFGNKKTWLQMSMTIFNRWGEKVFESNDMNFKWDGKFKGELQQPQVYVYHFQLTYINGYTIPVQKGSITLIR